MQIFDSDKIYSFMKFRYWALAISTLLMVGSICLLLVKGFNYGIDFSGGTLIQVRYESAAPIEEIRKRFEGVESLKGASVTEFGSPEEVTIRYPGSSDSLGSDPGMSVAKILEGSGKFEVRRVDVVGPKVGGELKQKGLMAVCVSLMLILIYIAVRFEWRFALAAIVTEFHDVFITLGAIILFKIDFNLEILAAILTILGYSLNDTIIVFDRVREGVKESKSTDISYVIDEAVSRTLSRTILTSFTTLISVVILYFWGGDMIKGFAFVMLVGVVVGTVSSIFVSAQTLIWLKFSILNYREFLTRKQKKAKEKEKIRAMYEKGAL